MKSRGFTLIELVVVLSIFSLIAVVVSLLYVSGLTQEREESLRSQLVLKGETAVDIFTRDVQSAWQVAASYTSGGTTYTSGGSTLVLGLPAVDASGNLISSGGSFTTDYVVYRTAVPYTYRSVFPAAGSSRQARTDQALINKQYADGSTPFSYQDATTGGLQNSSASQATYVTWFVPMQQQFKGRLVKYNAGGFARLRNKA